MSSGTEDQTTLVEERRASCCDTMWLATVEGCFKLLEWISTLLAFVIMLATFHAPIRAYSGYPEYNFMLFVAITSWLIVTLHIILRLPQLWPFCLSHPIALCVCCGLAAIAFLIASSVVLAYSYNLKGLKASAACGYIAMFLFLLEAIYNFCRVNCATTQATTEMNTVETVENGTPTTAQPSKPENNNEKAAVTAHEFPT